MLVAFTSVVGFNCTTPAASSWRTPPSRPARRLVAVRRRAVFLVLEAERPKPRRFLPARQRP